MKCLTAPGANALWVMYEPILMAKESFEKLSAAQQAELLMQAKEAEEFAYKASIDADKKLVDAYKNAGVKVVEMTAEQAAMSGARSPTPRATRHSADEDQAAATSADRPGAQRRMTFRHDGASHLPPCDADGVGGAIRTAPPSQRTGSCGGHQWDLFIRFTDARSRACSARVAAILLLVAVIVVCQMVFLRYGLNESTSWQMEFVTYA